LPSLHIDTPPLFHVELEKDGWEKVDMLWYQGTQNIGLSNHKLKSALKCTVWMITMHAHPRRMDRQMDEHHGDSATNSF